MKYKLIEASNATELAEKVNVALEDDWALLGSPFVYVFDGYRHFHQAIVKSDLSD